MTEDIVERLKKNFEDKYPCWTIQGEAAETIDKLRAENDELRDLGVETHKQLTRRIDVAANLADGLVEMKEEIDELKKQNEWMPIEAALPEIPFMVSDGNKTSIARLRCVGPLQNNLAWCIVGEYLKRLTFDPTHCKHIPSAPK